MESCKACDVSGAGPVRIGATVVIQCPACGTAWLAAPPSASELAGYYQSQYRISAPDSVSIEHRRMFRQPEQVRLIAELARLRPAPARVLDVGCDRGFFLDEARRWGYDGIGVEPSEAAREYGRAIGVQMVPSLAEVSGEFGLITLWHTLEHVPEPLELLRDMISRLSADGLVALRVPDFGCTWRRLLGERWIWFQPRNHCMHFTAAGLEALLERAGAKVVTIRSQKPNTSLTARAGALSDAVFRKEMGREASLRSRAARMVENQTGVELFAIVGRGNSSGRA